MVKQAVMNLASKLVPNIKFEIGAWTANTRLNAQWSSNAFVCTHWNNFNIDYTIGWAGWSIDTSIVDNAGAETPSMSQIGQEVLNSIHSSCANAIRSFNNVHKSCDCPIAKAIVQVVTGGGCFPAEAMVVTPQGKKQISELKVGDCVLSKRADGSVDTCDEVYMFGHAEHGTNHLYHKLSLSSGSSIHLTNKHFIHTSKSSATQFKQAVLKYAEDVSVGDWIWGANGEASQVYTVERVVLKGAFNPYTTSGNIIVDEVVASAHSEWFLDEAVPRSVTRYLPAIYQSILSLNRVLHTAFGPVAAETLGLANNGDGTAGDFWISYWPVVAASLAALVAAVSSKTRKLKTL
jgi:desert hedgehog protein